MKRTNIIQAGREIVIGSGNRMQYAVVVKIEGTDVYVAAGGRQRLIKLAIERCRVDLGRQGFVQAALTN